MYRKSRHFSYDVKCLTVFERFAYADAGKLVGTGAAQAQLNRLARIYSHSHHKVQGRALDPKTSHVQADEQGSRVGDPMLHA
jgi:hypothetical protein